LLGVDGGSDIKHSLLVGIYKRIGKEQLQPDSDHTSKLIAVDNSVTGLQKPVLTCLLTYLCVSLSSDVNKICRKYSPSMRLGFAEAVFEVRRQRSRSYSNGGIVLV